MKSFPLNRIVLLVLVAAAAAGAAAFLAAQTEDESPSELQIESITSRRSTAPTPVAQEVDEKAPDFELATLDGESFRMSNHEGEVIVINFWATWCAPCRVEIPDLIEMQKALREEHVRFLGISLDYDGMEPVREFAEDAKFNYPIAVDDGAVAEKFGGVYALPTTFVIDREGIIRHRIPGLVTKDFLMPILQELAGARQ